MAHLILKITNTHIGHTRILTACWRQNKMVSKKPLLLQLKNQIYQQFLLVFVILPRNDNVDVAAQSSASSIRTTHFNPIVLHWIYQFTEDFHHEAEDSGYFLARYFSQQVFIVFQPYLLVFGQQIGFCFELIDWPHTLRVDFFSFIRPYPPNFAEHLHYYPLLALLQPLQFFEFASMQ